MKNQKLILLAVILLTGIGMMDIAAATYDNNEFQRKSRAYSELALKAYDAGDYDAALQYALEAEKYAGESAVFIEKMLARSDAESVLQKAHTRLVWAKGINAEKAFPSEWAAASSAIAKADAFFSAEEYSSATGEAEKAIEALASIKEIIPLPKYYTVDPWDASKDCFWNIAKNPAVYGDPFLWHKLYEANRKALKRPSDPNLLMPGMIVTIPSLKGELREGTYDPSRKYEPFKK